MDVLQSLPANLSVSAPPDVPSGEEAEKRVLHARIKELKDQVEEIQTRVRRLEALLNSDGIEHEVCCLRSISLRRVSAKLRIDTWPRLVIRREHLRLRRPR